MKLYVPAIAVLIVAAFGVSTLREPAPTAAGASPAESEETLVVAFWNVENLFDADDDPENPGDDEYLPAREWTESRYATKLSRLEEVIAEVKPHLIGFAEVENSRVLTDLAGRPALKELGYQVAHLDSPDKRGIDNALAYRAPFTLVDGSMQIHEIPIDPATRGIFAATLEAHGQRLHVLVNHWPSRGGGDKTVAYRKFAAEVCRRAAADYCDSEKKEKREGDVLIIGDMNDDPFDPSVREHLGAVRSRNAVANRRNRFLFYNPSWSLLGRPDVGTLYYNREWVWNVFDQMVVSKGMLDDDGFTWVEGSLDVYGPDKLRDKYRRPLRFRKDRGKWREGYSDHLLIHGRIRVSPEGS